MLYFLFTEAIANMDDDGIMLQIYDNIGDELKAKNKLLEKEKHKVVPVSFKVFGQELCLYIFMQQCFLVCLWIFLLLFFCFQNPTVVFS